MNKLHVKSAQRNQADILEVLENLASQEDLSDKVTTEQMNTAISQAVAGRLPVYEVTGEELLIEFVNENGLVNKSVILKVGTELLLVGNIDKAGDEYSFQTCVLFSGNYNKIYWVDSSYSTDDNADIIDVLFEVMHEDAIELATQNYVDQNKGTKLYRHELILYDGNNSYSIGVITTTSTQFVVQGGPPVPTTDGKIISVGASSYPCVGNYSENRIYNLAWWNVSSFELVNLTSCTIVSDTVTPL